MKVGSILTDINRMEYIIKTLNESDEDNKNSMNIYAPCSISSNDAEDIMMYLRRYINVLKDIDISEK